MRLPVLVIGFALGCGPTPTAQPVPTTPTRPPTAVPLRAGEEIGVFMHGTQDSPRMAKAVRPKLAPCRARAMSAVPPRQGWVELELEVDEDGHVTATRLKAHEGLETPVVDCVRDAAKTFNFASPDGGKATVYLWVSLR